jgi:hypothetical protein
MDLFLPTCLQDIAFAYLELDRAALLERFTRKSNRNDSGMFIDGRIEWGFQFSKNLYVKVTTHACFSDGKMSFMVGKSKTELRTKDLKEDVESFLRRDDPKWISRFCCFLGIAKLGNVLVSVDQHE